MLEATLPNGKKVYQWQKSETDFLFKEIFTDDSYGEANGIKIESGDVVIDCGANIGMFSLWALEKTTKSGEVHAFEPIPTTFSALELNAKAHGNGKWHANNCGVSDSETTITFEHHPRCSIWSTTDHDMAEKRAERTVNEFVVLAKRAGVIGMLIPGWFFRMIFSRLVKTATKTVEVQAKLIKLSDYIDRKGIKKVDLLKVDVEGAELSVLKGIEARHWPMIKQVALEVENDRLRDACTEILTNNGFHVRCDGHVMDTEYSTVSMVYASRERDALFATAPADAKSKQQVDSVAASPAETTPSGSTQARRRPKKTEE